MTQRHTLGFLTVKATLGCRWQIGSTMSISLSCQHPSWFLLLNPPNHLAWAVCGEDPAEVSWKNTSDPGQQQSYVYSLYSSHWVKKSQDPSSSSKLKPGPARTLSTCMTFWIDALNISQDMLGKHFGQVRLQHYASQTSGTNGDQWRKRTKRTGHPCRPCAQTHKLTRESPKGGQCITYRKNVSCGVL